MAHPNIYERRREVAVLLAQGVAVVGPVRKELACRFGCSTAAIHGDLIALAREPNAPIYMQAKIRRQVMARDDRCQYCLDREAKHLVAEHVIPAALGGHARLYNLVAACQRCNLRKGRTVWVPANLEAITADHPAWRAKIIEMAERCDSDGIGQEE